MIKTILFDLGGVIVPLDFQRGYRAMEQWCSYPAAEIPKRIGSTDLVRRFETGLVPPEAFVRELSGILELRISYREFCDLWSSIFPPHTLVPESLVAALSRRYRLLLVSNTNIIHFEMIRANYPLLAYFDDYILSYRVGALKPSAKIYEAAIARAGCAPEECFFTDDIPLYVEGARAAGIDAVRFHSPEQLELELKARGVEW